MAYVKTNWINNTTPINATNLNKIENELEALDKDINYSTTEQVIGTWIDGKPIYRKVITGNAPSTDWTDFAQLSSLNIDTCINIKGNLYQDNNWNIPINTYESNDYYILVSWNRTYISYKKNGWTSNPTLILIIEYTKTTD